MYISSVKSLESHKFGKEVRRDLFNAIAKKRLNKAVIYLPKWLLDRAFFISEHGKEANLSTDQIVDKLSTYESELLFSAIKAYDLYDNDSLELIYKKIANGNRVVSNFIKNAKIECLKKNTVFSKVKSFIKGEAA